MSRRCRLYLITPPEVPDIAAFAHLLDQALDGGDVASLQIRLKSRDGVAAPDSHILELGRHIVPRAQDRGVAVLINDRPDLAVELGADGVHIGQSDMPYGRARKLVGDDGVSVAVAHRMSVFQESHDLHVRQIKLVLDCIEPMAHRLAIGLFD